MLADVVTAGGAAAVVGGSGELPEARRATVLPFFDAVRKDGESECIRFDTPSAPMPALREAPVCNG